LGRYGFGSSFLEISKRPNHKYTMDVRGIWRIPIPLSFGDGVLLAILDFSSLDESDVMVWEEGVLENVLASGPRCVSLSSKGWYRRP
jgi:hypothetical protein